MVSAIASTPSASTTYRNSKAGRHWSIWTSKASKSKRSREQARRWRGHVIGSSNFTAMIYCPAMELEMQTFCVSSNIGISLVMFAQRQKINFDQ